MAFGKNLIATEDVACVYLLLYIIKNGIVAVGDDGLRLCFELIEIVNHSTTKKSSTIF